MEVFLDGEEVGEDVVGERLKVTVDWVEGVRGEGGWYDPFVVWFVDVLVDKGVVLPSMDPINAVIRKDQEPNSLIQTRQQRQNAKNKGETRTMGSRGRTKANRVRQYCRTTSNTPKPLPQTTEGSRASSRENPANSSRFPAVPGSSETSDVSSWRGQRRSNRKTSKTGNTANELR